MKITCKNCKSEIDVKFFFDNIKISQEQYQPGSHIDYHARARGTAICYKCGSSITEHFNTILHDRDIIKMATQQENIY